MSTKRKRSAAIALLLVATPLSSCDEPEKVMQEPERAKQDCDWSPYTECAPETSVARHAAQPNGSMMYYYMYMGNLNSYSANRPYFVTTYRAAPTVSHKSSYSGVSRSGPSISRGGFGLSAIGSAAS